MFDAEERELLAAHKERFICNVRSAREGVMEPLQRGQGKSVMEFGESVLDMFAGDHLVT